MTALSIAIVLATTGATTGSYPAAQCTSCHARSRAQLEASVHGAGQLDAAIGCTDCHATHGKLDAPSANAPLRAGADLATCGGCHASELEIYRSTYHGKHQALGKANVPTCAFCHAGHELPRTEQRSPLFPANVARVCASCHADGAKDQAAMAATLSTPDTGRYLYRKNAGAWLVKLVLGALTLVVGGVGVLFLLQWIRMRRGEPAPQAPPTPRWLYMQLAAFVGLFVVIEQSGIALLYSAPAGGPLDRAMNAAATLVMGVFGSDDARSLAHRLVGGALVALVLVHIASVLLSAKLRRRLRMPARVYATLAAETRRGVRPGADPGLDLWPLFYRLVLSCVLLMIATGIAQWKAFSLMSSAGFGAVRYADLTHEWTGRALAIGMYGVVLGYGVGLRGLGWLLTRRRARAVGAAAATSVLAGLLALVAGCSGGSSPTPSTGKIDLQDVPRHGSTVADPMPGVSPRVFPSAETCKNCHPREYAEWKKSYHSGSVTLPTFRAMYTIFNFGTQGAKPEYCFYCHAPESKLLGKDYVATLSKAVLAGEPVPSGGVTCAACHMIADIDPAAHLWNAAARYDVASAPPYHAAFKSQVTTSAAVCSGCHDYNNLNLPKPDAPTTPCCTVYRGWEKTPAARKGVTCQDCHMGDYMDVGPDDRPSDLYALVGLGRYVDDRGAISHLMPGSRSEDMLKKAIAMRVVKARVAGGRLDAQVEIENRAAHNIPDG